MSEWNTGTFFKEADLEDVKRYIEAGIDVNERNEFGDTPLHHAAFYCGCSVVRYLIESGADVNSRDDSICASGNTPLHCAVLSEHVPVVRLLLESGADVNARSACGAAPLHFAARYNNNLEVSKLLIKSGADLTLRARDYKESRQAGKTAYELSFSNQKMIAKREIFFRNNA